MATKIVSVPIVVRLLPRLADTDASMLRVTKIAITARTMTYWIMVLFIMPPRKPIFHSDLAVYSD